MAFFSVVTHEKWRDFNPATWVPMRCCKFPKDAIGNPELGFARGRAENFALKNHVYYELPGSSGLLFVPRVFFPQPLANLPGTVLHSSEPLKIGKSDCPGSLLNHKTRSKIGGGSN